MNIEDMLIEYTGLSAKRREVYEKLMKLEEQANKILFENKEPFELNDADGNFTGVTITVPDDLWVVTPGTVLAVNGTEWLRLNDNWVSCYGAEFTDNLMFVNIMRHRDTSHQIHKGY